MQLNSKMLVVSFLFFIVGGSTIFGEVHKINEDLYIGQKEDGLYFAMEKVDRWNIDFWRKYIEWQKTFRNRLPDTSKIKSGSFDGILGFQSYIDSFNSASPEYDLWVSYATSKLNLKNKNKKNRRFFKISSYQDALSTFEDFEMAFCVATTKDSPFVTHMGIGRGLAFTLRNHPPHKKIALDLHSFAAKVIKTISPNKLYMITTPTPAMREIFIADFPKQGLYLGDNNYESSLHTLMSAYENQLTVTQDGFERLQLQSNLSLATAALAQYRSHPSPITLENDRFTLHDHSEATVLDIDLSASEYRWFFDHAVQRPRPPEYIWTSVDLELLAAFGTLQKLAADRQQPENKK